jgi:NAD-dependent SIR2 family protein deacetylase
MTQCDLLLIIGTSLKVYPFAGLPASVSRECPRVVINREPLEQFGIKEWRDLVLLGDCDEIVQKILL